MNSVVTFDSKTPFPKFISQVCYTGFGVDYAIPVDIYMFKVNNKDTRTVPMASFRCLYC